MNLTLHIVRKDLRRLRGWIACWVGLLLIPIVLGAQLLGNNPLADSRWNLPNTLSILTGFQLIVGCVVTILLLHEDAIVGTRQFWLTRPISRWRLLRAKTIGALVVVGVLPAVVSLPWWLWCGLGVREVGLAAVETVAVLSVVIVAAAVVATLTDTFPRALLWTVPLVAIALFAMMYFTFVHTTRVQSSPEMAMVISRTVLAVLVSVLGGATVVAIQFHVRRRGWRLGLAAVSIALLVAATTRWPRPWGSPIPEERDAARAGSVQVRFERAETDRAAKVGPAREPDQRVFSYLFVSGVPDGFGVSGVGASLRWRWNDGTSIGREEPLHWLQWDNQPVKRELRQGEAEFVARAVLPRSMVERMKSDAPRLDVRGWWRLNRIEISPALPLTPGGWHVRDAHRLRIKAIELNAGRAKAVVIQTRPVTITGLLREAASASHPFGPGKPVHELSLITIDRARGNVVDGFLKSDGRSRSAIVNGVEVRWRVLSAPMPEGGRNERERGATELALAVLSDVALFSREIKVERFELANPP